MTLSSILSTDQIILEMEATDRWQAIDELMAKLVECGKVSEEKASLIKEAVRKRESTMSTGIGNGIGLPHASTPHIDEVVAVFGRSVKGINFDSIDDQPVNVVLLLLVPQGQIQKHLQTLGNISRLFHSNELRQSINKARSAETIFDILGDRSIKDGYTASAN